MMETYQNKYGWEKNMDSLISEGWVQWFMVIFIKDSSNREHERWFYQVSLLSKMWLLEDEKCAIGRNNAMFYRGLSLQGSA